MQYIHYYHDPAKVKHAPPAVNRFSLGNDLSDTMLVDFPSVRLSTTAQEWSAILDVVGNVLFVTDAAEQASLDRLAAAELMRLLLGQTAAQRVSSIVALQQRVR